MGSLDTPPSWSDPIVLASIERAFDATWPVIRAYEASADKARMAELSMALSHKLVELAAAHTLWLEHIERTVHVPLGNPGPTPRQEVMPHAVVELGEPADLRRFKTLTCVLRNQRIVGDRWPNHLRIVVQPWFLSSLRDEEGDSSGFFC